MAQIVPTAIKEARGSYKNHPERRNENEMQPLGGIGPAPDHAGAYAETWDEIVKAMPPGVLGNTDRIAIEMLCKLVVKMRFDFEHMNAAEMTRLETLLARFGMTPADRTKITVPKGEKKNPFEGM